MGFAFSRLIYTIRTLVQSCIIITVPHPPAIVLSRTLLSSPWTFAQATFYYISSSLVDISLTHFWLSLCPAIAISEPSGNLKLNMQS